MDILGWDCPVPNDDFPNDHFAEDDAKHDPIADNSSYDLWELNCCVVRDAYWRSDTSLWNRVFAFWDEVLE